MLSYIDVSIYSKNGWREILIPCGFEVCCIDKAQASEIAGLITNLAKGSCKLVCPDVSKIEPLYRIIRDKLK